VAMEGSHQNVKIHAAIKLNRDILICGSCHTTIIRRKGTLVVDLLVG
jgi:hypothetical protein